MSTSKTLLALTLCASLLGAEAAQAFPASSSTRPVAAATGDTSSLVEQARYRGGYGGYGYRGGRGYGRGAIGLGIAGAIIGGAIIANEGYRYRTRRYASTSARQQCADTYRSFDWDSGTYMGYDGVRHVCPYL
jgi:BA14K-like protein